MSCFWNGNYCRVHYQAISADRKNLPVDESEPRAYTIHMPKAHPKELRELAFSLYLQGLTLPKVAEHVKLPVRCVQGWCTRQDWRQRKAQVQAKIAEVPAKSAALAVAEQSVRTRELLAATLKTDADAFANIYRRSGLHALELNAKAEPLVRNAAKVFGWEPGVSVQIGIIGESTASDFDDVVESNAKLDAENT